ncbi:FUT6, partial [Symbiodinium pilosum]
ADPDFRYEGFSGLNDSEQAASADKESANEDAALPTTQFVSTAPTLAPAPVANAVRPGRAKLIFVNCAEDAKIVRKGGQFKVLPCPHQCNMTVDKSDLSRADAVVFNPLWMSPLKKAPRTKAAGQIWAYSFHFESASAHGFARGATKALSAKMDLTMTYKGKSDIFRPFYSLRALRPGQDAPDPHKDYAKGKEHLLLWLVGNCGSKSRMRLFQKLQKLLGADKAHMFGSCGKSTGCTSKHSADP